MSQTSYSINQAAARVGMIADTSKVKDVESYQNPAAAVFIGRVVTKGGATNEVVHPDAATEITDEKLVRGVVVHAHECESRDDGLGPNYPAKSVVPVMRKGRIWVKAEDAITEGTSTVNVRFADGAASGNGALRGAADSSFTAVLPKAKWKSSTSGPGQLAVLEIDL